MINRQLKQRVIGLLALSATFLAVLTPASGSEMLIEVAREQLPDRKECRSDFRQIWEKEFSQAHKKFQIYENAWSDLRKQKQAIEATRDEAETKKAVSDLAIGVKLIAGWTNTGLVAAAKVRKALPKQLEDGITISRATIDWVVEKLRRGDYTAGQLINSFASDEFHEFLSLRVAASKSVLLDAALQMTQFVDDYERQESEYAAYRKELRELVNNTDRRIEETKRSMEREQDRLFNLYHNAFQIFCQNKAPRAEDDHAKVDGTATLTILVLENDHDPENRALSIRNPRVTDGEGNVRASQDGKVFFTAREGFTGRAIVSYEVIDDLGETAQAKIYIDVAADQTDDALDDDLLQAALNTVDALKQGASLHDSRIHEAEVGRQGYANSVIQSQINMISAAASGTSQLSMPSSFGSTAGDSGTCAEGKRILTDMVNRNQSRIVNSQGICGKARGMVRFSQQALAQPSIRNCPALRAQLNQAIQSSQQTANQVCTN